MAMSCGQAGRLSLASAGGHASEAERLELEAHLAACARCSAEHAVVVSTTRTLRASEVPTLSPAARQRVWRAALSRRAHAPAARRPLGWPLAMGAAVAMAAAAAIWIGVRAPSQYAIVAGDVTAAPQASTGGTSLRSGAAHGGVVKLADASGTLSPATEILWRHDRRVVELRQGALTIDLDHHPGQHFEVRTPRFTVEVVGTKFTVDMRSVRTERGKVRLLTPDGAEIGFLTAGLAWTAPDDATRAQASAPPAPPTEEPAPPGEPPVVAAAPGEDAGVRLGRARRALARGNAREARHLVEPLFPLGRDVAAEARAIYAESFLSERRYDDAIIRYSQVVRLFPGTPQAESATFAIAQLESEHGQPAVARATLQEYLNRYPHGRFAKEAAARLQQNR